MARSGTARRARRYRATLGHVRCGSIDRTSTRSASLHDHSFRAHSTSHPGAARGVSLSSTLLAVVALSGCGGGGGTGVAAGPDVPPAAAVDGPAWWSFARDAQHAATGAVATQDLNRIAWSTPLDLAPPRVNGALLIHYGSPVVTSHNTVVVPVKTAAAAAFASRRARAATAA